MHSSPLDVLIIHDEKPGHMSQLEGLSQALSKHVNVQCEYLSTSASQKSLSLNFIPQIVIGAGHATHSTILKVARKHKAFSVVLMKPSIPYYLFDAVICPQHDKLKESQRVFKTRGTINKVRPEQNSTGGRSYHLILLGGPSKNYHWDERKLIEQITSLCQYSYETEWLLVPSRRTPPSISDLIEQAQLPNLQFGNTNTLSSPLDKLLLHSRMAWVTPDSQSMLYEAITAGSPSGIFDLPLIKRKKSERINQQTQTLIAEGLITSFKTWSDLQTTRSPEVTQLIYPPAPSDFCEADHAAQWLLDRYIKTRKRENTAPLEGNKT